jgi:hypothetical protein
MFSFLPMPVESRPSNECVTRALLGIGRLFLALPEAEAMCGFTEEELLDLLKGSADNQDGEQWKVSVRWALYEGASLGWLDACKVTRSRVLESVIQRESVIQFHAPRHARGKLRGAVEELSRQVTLPEGIVFSEDYHTCRWGSETFTFTFKQARAVQFIWEERVRGVSEVHLLHILEAAESDLVQAKKPQLRRLFMKGQAYHPAWGRMIVQGEKLGTYKIADPPTS